MEERGVPDKTLAVLVEDLESLVEVFVVSWIGSLGDVPEVGEELVQGDHFFFHVLGGELILELSDSITATEEV